MKEIIKQDGPSRNEVRAGRPRSVKTQEAVLSASLRLTEQIGYSRLTMEGIASEAGVGKQTIYRWWSSKAAVVLEAFTQDAKAIVNIKVTGDMEADLATFLAAVHRRLSGPSGIVFRSLLAEALIDPGFGTALYDQYLQSRVDDLKAVIGVENCNRLSRDVLDQVVEMTYGAIWYRLVCQLPLTPTVAKRLAKAAVAVIGSSK